MDCESFRNQLDEGGEDFLPPDRREGFRAHAAACPACRAAAAGQQRLGEHLRRQAPSPTAASALAEQVLGRLKTEVPVPPVAPFWLRFLPLAFGFAVVGLLVAWPTLSVWVSPPGAVSGPVSPAQALLRGTIVAVNGAAPSGPDEIRLNPGDRFTLAAKSGAHLELPNGAVIDLAAEGAFQWAAMHTLEISSAQGEFAFPVAGREVELRLPLTILRILGTVVHVRVGSNGDRIWVARGKVAWRQRSGNLQGVLAAGEGLKGDGHGVSSLTASPLLVEGSAPSTAMPSASPPASPPVSLLRPGLTGGATPGPSRGPPPGSPTLGRVASFPSGIGPRPGASTPFGLLPVACPVAGVSSPAQSAIAAPAAIATPEAEPPSAGSPGTDTPGVGAPAAGMPPAGDPAAGDPDAGFLGESSGGS